MVEVLCPAKVNLTLHVGAAIASGDRAGYHPVDSLVVFADMGDAIRFEPSEASMLEIDGPFSCGLSADTDNLILRTLTACDAPPQRVRLTKCLPVSAGLGGGSANAAAVLRMFDPNNQVDGARIGADIPVCRLSRTAMMRGIGERVTAVPGLGQVPAVLVNPGIAVSTARVFSRFDAAPRAAEPVSTAQTGSLLDRALSGRNDLQPVAIADVPIIEIVIAAIADQPGCQLARMSGSGASVFGLFDTDAAAQAAAKVLSARGWWSVATRLGDPA
ncbi:4-(cytidine 5'-diphospho)-2-C-methyl-D-erythritol kinase [Algimonas porphyrae]|uniref:4-diphosphocytidyl-2-C-methyl-D-erythritol kinase n=1 Tax=Algimonas porphyrae TaxID=1128113 RepID=A0ABQ5V0M3_9PROT|nr:4-(cytidine 5'-diphospho)-2-C-methyl-D-erythritol kinase [Algimonas porphyrae]GLQ20166.1 4-diphosphocytidyl-2-C-methyl-D-erythritol kinase [Algimonas porphyrae]